MSRQANRQEKKMETPLVMSRAISANPARPRSSSQVAIVAFGIACEISKQCTNFAAVYFSDDGRYPVPQTAIVLAIEVVKVVMVVAVLALGGKAKEVVQFSEIHVTGSMM